MKSTAAGLSGPAGGKLGKSATFAFVIFLLPALRFIAAAGVPSGTGFVLPLARRLSLPVQSRPFNHAFSG